MNRAAATDRIPALDLVRGVAVLGILAVNIAGFAGPPHATMSPGAVQPASTADAWTFAATFLLFEGKMRALFSLLFGASMLLYLDRKEAAGADGIALQVRRLTWLALFGYLHFLLLWWGDILFLYAVVGMATLPFHRLRPTVLVAIALAIFTLSQAVGVADWMPRVALEERVRLGEASDADLAQDSREVTLRTHQIGKEITAARGGFAGLVAYKWQERGLDPFHVVLTSFGETFPFMLIGMALFRSGFFSGQWSRRTLWRTAFAGVIVGGTLTLALLAWTMPRDFPLRAMAMVLIHAGGFPHLLMALGYGAALMLAAPWLLRTFMGQRLVAAGRMAFSNYIGTSLLMTAVFYGWGLSQLTGESLFATLGAAAQVPFVLLGWALMLAASTPWLRHVRQGPLEWVWRCLTEWRLLPFRR